MENKSNTTEKEENFLTGDGGNKPKPKPKLFKWAVLVLLILGLGVIVWFAIPETEKPIKPLELDEPFDDNFTDEEEAEYVDEETVASQECFNANMMNEDKSKIIENCEEAKVIECPEGMELNEGQTECVEYVDTATEETKVAPLEQLSKEQDKTMRQMISYLLNLYGNDKYLTDEKTFKAVMSKVLAPSYYQGEVYETTFKQLKQFNERTSEVNFTYSTVEVIDSRNGNNFDVYVTGTLNYVEKGKQKSEQKHLLLQVQTLPNSEAKISYFKFS